MEEGSEGQQEQKNQDQLVMLIPAGVEVGRPLWLSGKESACNAGDTVRSLNGEDPLEEGMAIHSSILV